MHVSKSLQGSKSAITMHPVSIESTSPQTQDVNWTFNLRPVSTGFAVI